jgi:hypothetical protein
MTLTLSPDLTATSTDSGMVLLDERSGKYWMLNRTGATALRLMLAGRSAEDAAAEVAAGRDVDPARALADVEALIGSLRKARLVAP